MNSVPAILIAVTLGVIGQLLVKKGLNSLGFLNFSSGFLASYAKIFLTPLVICGTLSYASSVFFWLYALAKVDLSFAYPFLAIGYVLVIMASWLILGESIPPLRWGGVMFICIGLILISRS